VTTLAVTAGPGGTWLIVVALLVLVLGRRPVGELAVAVAGRLRRAPSRPEVAVRRRDGVDALVVWNWPTPKRVDADVPLTVPTWCAPRVAGRTPRPRRAAA
jgi:hypothetical protein